MVAAGEGDDAIRLVTAAHGPRHEMGRVDGGALAADDAPGAGHLRALR
jgi:hypothetical protein